MIDKAKIKNNKYLLPLSIIAAAVILAYGWTHRISFTEGQAGEMGKPPPDNVLPSGGAANAVGYPLPIKWSDIGQKLISVGVIDKQKLLSLYAARGGLNEEERKLLAQKSDSPIVINEQNSGFLLNLFWALGLGNKNPILEKGEMTDPRYGGEGNFASTGGWTISEGEPTDHYSRHLFIALTSKQQKLVEETAKHIYRPCCDNSTHFPDCNHGMAMLGLLELLAANGASEGDLYKTALAVNSYWFPETYAVITDYLKAKNMSWKTADPKELLGINYSSGSGFRRIAADSQGRQKRTGAGCGVPSGLGNLAPAREEAKEGGCGV